MTRLYVFTHTIYLTQVGNCKERGPGQGNIDFLVKALFHAYLVKSRLSSSANKTKIKPIVFGGQSTVPLHRQTIRVEKAERVAGQRVLLLYDIAQSGHSFIAYRILLYEAGAEIVQAALGRVIDGQIAYHT